MPQTVMSILRGDEESACAHKLGDPQLPRKAPVESTAVGDRTANRHRWAGRRSQGA